MPPYQPSPSPESWDSDPDFQVPSGPLDIGHNSSSHYHPSSYKQQQLDSSSVSSRDEAGSIFSSGGGGGGRGVVRKLGGGGGGGFGSQYLGSKNGGDGGRGSSMEPEGSITGLSSVSAGGGSAKSSWGGEEEEDDDWGDDFDMGPGVGGGSSIDGDSSKGDTIKAKLQAGEKFLNAPDFDGEGSTTPSVIVPGDTSVTGVIDPDKSKESTIKALPSQDLAALKKASGAVVSAYRPAGLGGGRSGGGAKKTSSGLSGTEADDEDFESDFELPASMSQMSLSPGLKKERLSTFPRDLGAGEGKALSDASSDAGSDSGSIGELRSGTAPGGTKGGLTVVKPPNTPSGRSITTTSSSVAGSTQPSLVRSRSASISSIGFSEAETDGHPDEDDAFFDDLVLPSYFGNGGGGGSGGSTALRLGRMTPPPTDDPFEFDAIGGLDEIGSGGGHNVFGGMGARPGSAAGFAPPAKKGGDNGMEIFSGGKVDLQKLLKKKMEKRLQDLSAAAAMNSGRNTPADQRSGTIKTPTSAGLPRPPSSLGAAAVGQQQNKSRSSGGSQHSKSGSNTSSHSASISGSSSMRASSKANITASSSSSMIKLPVSRWREDFDDTDTKAGLVIDDGIKLGRERVKEATSRRSNLTERQRNEKKNRVNLRSRVNSAAPRLGGMVSGSGAAPSRVKSPINMKPQAIPPSSDPRPRSVAGVAGPPRAKSALGGALTSGHPPPLSGRRSPVPGLRKQPQPSGHPPSTRARTLSSLGGKREEKGRDPPRPSLKGKKSVGNLNLMMAGTAANAGTASAPKAAASALTRKRSMPSLKVSASNNAGGETAAATGAGSKDRARVNTMTTPQSSAGFAQPTASSISRAKRPSAMIASAMTTTAPPEKGSHYEDMSMPSPNSPLHGRSSSLNTPSSGSGQLRPATPSGGSSLMRPTQASLAKARSAGRGTMNSSSNGLPNMQLLRRPKRVRQYGDGTELDAFDDLPTSRDSESPYLGRLKFPSGAPAPKRAAATRAPSTDTVKPGAPKSTGSSSRNATTKSKKPSTLVRRTRGGLETKRSSQKPQLIRNLNTSNLQKVQGEMVWNPIQQRWEGNEGVLRDFERTLSTSTRPALITNLSTTSSTGPSPSRPPNAVGGTKLSNGVRIVGNMVFDPVKMCWFSQSPDGEDDLDLELYDEEDDDDGWERGERDRMLKNRASFMSEPYGEGSVGGSEGELDPFWKDCLDAERRHADEMVQGGWFVDGSEGRRARGERDYLWDIRTLILGR